ncbi:hypothetical protein D3C76_1662500 [compost metagenome]
MHLLANAVPAILAHHAVAGGLGMALDCMANVAQGRARAHLLDAFAQRVIGGVDQALGVFADRADAVHL